MTQPKKLETRIAGGICGVYSITTPSGKQYIGSSTDIRRRWYDHHWRMKNGKSSSPKLNAAYRKYGLALKFEIVEECAPSCRIDLEQRYIDARKPEMNASLNAYCAPLCAARLGADLSAGAKSRRRPVEDAEGRIYESITHASREMGCSDSAMRRRLKYHDPFPCGARFRFLGEEWKPMRPTPAERKRESFARLVERRRAQGGPVHSEKARREKSQRLKGVPWTPARRAAHEAKAKAKAKEAGQ